MEVLSNDNVCSGLEPKAEQGLHIVISFGVVGDGLVPSGCVQISSFHGAEEVFSSRPCVPPLDSADLRALLVGFMQMALAIRASMGVGVSCLNCLDCLCMLLLVVGWLFPLSNINLNHKYYSI